MIVLGGALAVFGISGFEAHVGSFGGAAWDIGDRIEIAVGVGLFILGISLRRSTTD
jgi:hypothetical protein